MYEREAECNSIVADLRMVSGNDYCLCAKAADEIILLRERLRECNERSGELVKRIFEAAEREGELLARLGDE